MVTFATDSAYAVATSASEGPFLTIIDENCLIAAFSSTNTHFFTSLSKLTTKKFFELLSPFWKAAPYFFHKVQVSSIEAVVSWAHREQLIHSPVSVVGDQKVVPAFVTKRMSHTLLMSSFSSQQTIQSPIFSAGR